MKKVYCKKDFYRDGTAFHKYKIYYISNYDSRFSNFVQNLDRTVGRWIGDNAFEEHFTFDNKFLREEKLMRITNE